ncbi:MAG: ribosomal protein S12 methylthiotransferase RimO, partial [Candidatus Solincola sediminis]
MANNAFYLISLGCPKNEVDSDSLISGLFDSGWQKAKQPQEADVILVTTCSFIQTAVEEAVESILEAVDFKEGGARKLVVAGCLVSRYGKPELEKLLPEVDLFIDFPDYAHLPELLGSENVMKAGTPRNFSSTLEKGYVYIKLGEGCRRACSFCTIPKIRGPLVSRPWQDIRDEALFFISQGIKELVLIAQDTTSYGIDLYGKSYLAFLIDRLCELEGDFRLRLMYLHPEGIDHEILYSMADPKVYPYVDIPLQHVDPAILRKMNRGGDGASHHRLLDRIRYELGDVSLRATFMTGFPGEDDASFAMIEDFIASERFDWLGLFRYSQEEGTRAFSIPGMVEADRAEERLIRLTELQEEIMRDKARGFIGRRLQVLVEGRSLEAPGYWEARSWREAPEVDGVI